MLTATLTETQAVGELVAGEVPLCPAMFKTLEREGEDSGGKMTLYDRKDL